MNLEHQLGTFLNHSAKTWSNRFIFEITHVELLADLSAIQIHWLCSSDECINLAVETFLNLKLANQIRVRLIEERVINYVPRIVFCRDHSRVLNEKLEFYLEKIKPENKIIFDFNEDNILSNDDHTKKKEGRILITELMLKIDTYLLIILLIRKLF